MTTALVGHRGVGKSTLLGRLAQYGYHVLDLDRYIEQREGCSITEIFSTLGEDYFRGLEKKYFAEAMVMEPHFIAMGAGFNFALPQSVEVVWLRRVTDKGGRVFLDRPRLDLSVSPIEEFLKKYENRDQRFLNMSDVVYEMPEGKDCGCELEKNILAGGRLDLNAILTVFSGPKGELSRYFERRSSWGVSAFELRNDLLTDEEISEALKYLEHEKVLFSIRRRVEVLPHGISKFDWALELGECPIPKPDIYSLHVRPGEMSLTDTLSHLGRFEKDGAHIKLAIEIKNFSELMLCHKWQKEAPERRSFLPTSIDGRWRWYRLLSKAKQSLNFVNEGFSSVLDQPSMLEWLSSPVCGCFAAVLGDPVEHSFSPQEHQKFFLQRNMPFFKIRVSESEWTEAIAALEVLGLKYAAVTSPLKKNVVSGQSANTLYFDREWQYANTDIDGLKEMLASHENGSIAVWGGGGLLENLRVLLPNANFYSATSGEVRGEPSFFGSPDVVVWAVGRSRFKVFPPESWQPRLIIDLNYTEDSPGREYALRCGAGYKDGLKMFRTQALAQRRFWQQCEGPLETQRVMELR